MGTNNVTLIDPSLSFKDKIKYVIKFITRSFMIAVFVVAFIFVILSSIYLFDVNLNVKKGAYKYPIFGTYVIVSRSMVPTIKVLDGIVVKRVNNFNMGDIITFDSTDIAFKDKTITHRIVGTETLTNGDVLFRTKGDNNLIQDRTLVPSDNIHGRVVLTIPKIGYLQGTLANPIYLTFILLFVGFGVVYRTKKEIQREVEVK